MINEHRLTSSTFPIAPSTTNHNSTFTRYPAFLTSKVVNYGCKYIIFVVLIHRKLIELLHENQTKAIYGFTRTKCFNCCLCLKTNHLCSRLIFLLFAFIPCRIFPERCLISMIAAMSFKSSALKAVILTILW